MEGNLENRIVTCLAVIIAIPFVVNIFYYGPSEGTWFTVGLYEQLFGILGDGVLRFLDAIFM